MNDLKSRGPRDNRSGVSHPLRCHVWTDAEWTRLTTDQKTDALAELRRGELDQRQLVTIARDGSIKAWCQE